MKIEEMNQNAAVAFPAGGRTDKSEPVESHSEGVAKQQSCADKVELSSYQPMDAASKGQQDLRANRVEEVKAQIANGSYLVSARAVAEKMLSKLVMTSLA